jgi:hypothetical protein
MKKQGEAMNLHGWRQIEYSGLEPFYSQEFIESEENEENNFYSFAGEDTNDNGEHKRHTMCS